MTLSSDSILIKFDQTQSKQKYISPTNDLGSEIFIGQQFNPTFQQLLNSKYDVFNASLVSVGLDGQEVLEREEAFENKLDKGMKTLCSQGTEFDQQFENINIDDENNSNKQNFPKSVDQAIENSKKMLIQTDQELQYPIGLLTMIEQNNLSKDSAYETRKSKQTQAKMKGMRILQKIMLFKRCSTIFSEAASNIRKVLHKDQERVRAIPNLQKKSLLRKQGDTSPVHVIWGMIPSSSGLTNERDKLEYQNYYQEEDVPFLIRDLNFSAPLPLHLYSQEIIQRVIGIQRRISAQAIMDEMKLFAQTLHFSSADCVEFSNSTPFCETGHKSNIHEIDKDQSQDNNDIFGQDEEDETWEPVDGECGNDGKKLINKDALTIVSNLSKIFFFIA
ncbi:MAG: hypothetical protein EZS28_022088 [Streblomastix strix]|uniref:Uncharacterized protein n=1 Tax=Streblomastix strix TaxID=222440 RepID=A0A5J4VIU0_9EUKA|nr:MAG: hypothetical protein EZS28_022088 [Streblomastix strix]